MTGTPEGLFLIVIFSYPGLPISMPSVTLFPFSSSYAARAVT